jgi:hypothetical protein
MANSNSTPKVRAKSAAGGRLRNARIERDKPADARATDCHRGMCLGYLGGRMGTFREFFADPHSGTRIHKEDARQMRQLLDEFEIEMRSLIRDVRIQQHGVRDEAIDDPAGADLSNVISIMDRKAKEASSHG